MSQTIASRFTSVVSRLMLITSWAVSTFAPSVQLRLRDPKTFTDRPQVMRLLSTMSLKPKMHMAVFCELRPSEYHFTVGLKGPVFFFSGREPLLNMTQEYVNFSCF